jgi:hypothetical protein
MIENRRSFHHELDEIRQGIVRLAAMVTEVIPRGTEVLLGDDLQAARALIEDDDAIDALSLEIEEHCYSVLALQQPMAGDLRAIVTAIRLVTEIERSGDLMVNIAKGARRLYGATFEPRIRGQRRPGRRPRRHRRPARRPPRRLHRGHLRQPPPRRAQRRVRRAARPHRPLLRTRR